MGNKSSVPRGGSGQRNPVFTTDSLQMSSEISSSRLLGGLYSWSKLIKVMTVGQIKASVAAAGLQVLLIISLLYYTS